MSKLPGTVRARLDIMETPLTRIEATGNTVQLRADDAAVFTSSNGVLHAPDAAGRTAFCVGANTTQTARSHGWAAVQMGDTADELTDALRANLPKQRLFHLSGTHIRGDIVHQLNAAGAEAKRVVVYDQVACTLTKNAQRALSAKRPSIVPLFSPRSAILFIAQAVSLNSAVLIAISEAVAECVPKTARNNVVISTAPNADAMAKALQLALHRLTPG